MVELGVYAVARLYWVVFAGPLGPHVDALRAILVAVGSSPRCSERGCASCSGTSSGCWRSRRSATSACSCAASALLSAKALAGVGVYIVAHGLTKAALFMCAGVLLHRFATIDEFDLHGRGRGLPLVGALFASAACCWRRRRRSRHSPASR